MYSPLLLPTSTSQPYKNKSTKQSTKSKNAFRTRDARTQCSKGKRQKH